MKTYFGWLKLIKVAIFSLMGFFLIFYPEYLRIKRSHCIVQHRIIMQTLKQHVDSGGQIPRNLSELALLEYSQQHIDGRRKTNLSSLISFQKEKHDLRYYPDAWGKPGRIFLQSSVLGTYAVIFGNGSFACVSIWNYQGHHGVLQPSEEVGVENGGELYDRVYSTFGPMILSFFCLLFSLFVLAVVERIMKKKLKNINE